ncbi:MAG: family 78 glycoside hydrolase catalytic domain [Bacteroidota bacterium]|jgi:alpha-L-rhamnosidase|nr:family 78 glycoside hydrolase catalytic domain [Bacteroidota bacterium]HHU97884.1 family 78 glycoside hydrolase catalytic domain [Petrimonas sp.]
MKDKSVKKIVIAAVLAIPFLCCTGKKKADIVELEPSSSIYWIGDGKVPFADDSLFYGDDPAPMFRKEFQVEEKLESATLFITAAGYYKTTINGKRVGLNYLDPAWTDTSKRVYYTEYDLSDLLNEGVNCVGVVLGNGFYNPLPLRMWGHRNLREALHVGRPVFLAKLVLRYENGEKVEVGTNENWKFAPGPILKNNVYLGEVYNANHEAEGWDLPGFDDSNWSTAQSSTGPGGKLQRAFFPPIQVTEQINPTNIYAAGKETFIVDMGVNFTGTYRVKLSGNPGDSIVFRFGERVHADGSLNPLTTVCGQIKQRGRGGPGSPNIAWQTDTYILKDKNPVWVQPEFTFHTFRYMEVSGLTEPPALSDITGLALHSAVEADNSFHSSSSLLNAIQDATRRTFKSNLQSVQSDCPAREKFGYGGDLNATSESFIYNFNMQSLYRKTVYDWMDAINDSVFVDTAPFVGIQYCGISWESAFLITQYYLLLYYNDRELVKEMYPVNKKWMEKVHRLHPGGLVDFGLGDHESLLPVPVQLIGTSHYLMCAEIMQHFASIMNDRSAEREYGQLAITLRKRLKEEFWDKPVTEPINKQTLFATLLYHQVIPEEEVERAADSLMLAVEEAPAGHFITGIFGTKYILEALSGYVSPEKVFEIVNSDAFPGWGYMISRGATTIWETWKESDDVYSNCHPMFGVVTEWFYRWLGGIRPILQRPGFEEFIIAPYTPEGLNEVKVNYRSPYGTIVSNWVKDKSKITYEFEVPQQSNARIKLNKDPDQEITITTPSDPSFDPNSVKGVKEGSFELGAGKYIVTVYHQPIDIQ